MNINQAVGATLLAAALMTGPIAAATAGPAPATVQSTSSTLGLFEQSSRQTIIETFDAINAFRASKNLKPLKFNAAISAVSQRWSKEMAATDDFVHNPRYAYAAEGIPGGWDSASENIAWASYAASGREFVGMWIKSPGHNANMSRPDDDYMGIGISSRDGGKTYATGNHFSYRDGVVPPGSYNHPSDFFSGKPQLKPATGLPSKTPVAPVFDTANRTFTIPTVEGVQYRVISNGSTWIKPPGTHPAGAGLHRFEAVAAEGYELEGSHAWQVTFPEDKMVTAQAPVFNQLAGTYTIPDVTGILYFANGEAKAAGTYPGKASGINIWVNTANGYALTENIGWSHDFSRVAPPNPFTRSGTYVIPKAAGVSYYLDGKVVKPGTYQAPARSTIIRARAHPGYGIAGPSAWSHDGRKAVTPAKPAMSSSTNRYTIPKRTGVTYLVDGKAVKPGTYTAPNGKTLKFTAKASASTYRLTGTTSWTFRF